MAIANLTEDYVRKLKVPEGEKDVVVWDEKLPGFGVRKYAKGHASYIVKYSVNGKSKKHTLGPVVEGKLKVRRQEAEDYLHDGRAGKDRRAENKAAAEAVARLKTLGELVGPYLEVRQKGDLKWDPLRPKTLVDFTRYLTKGWQPLHDKVASEITREMVEKGRDDIASAVSAKKGRESGAVSANRAHTALAGLFKWAIKNGYVTGANPTADIDPLREHDRKRYLIEPELAVVWQACEDDDFGRATKLLMLTGCRRQEIGGLLWGEINWEKRQIELPGERTKNGLPHIVPLSEPALAILRACEGDRCEGRHHVFAGAGLTSWYYGKQQLDKRIAARRGSPLDPWVIHDLRRSFVTHIAELRYAPPHVVEALVNHVSGAKAGVAGVYNRAQYLEERVEALDKWGRRLTERTRPFAVPDQQNKTAETADEIGDQLVSGTGV
jgi:integrase